MKKVDIEKLKNLLKKEFSQIEIAYIFGSAKEGNIKEGSDIDIAVLLKNNYNSMLSLEIGAFIEEHFKCKTDVVELNKANPILKHEVFKQRKRLFERDSTKRAIFEANSFRDYLDNIYYLRRRLAK